MNWMELDEEKIGIVNTLRKENTNGGKMARELTWRWVEQIHEYPYWWLPLIDDFLANSWEFWRTPFDEDPSTWLSQMNCFFPEISEKVEEWEEKELRGSGIQGSEKVPIKKLGGIGALNQGGEEWDFSLPAGH